MPRTASTHCAVSAPAEERTPSRVGSEGLPVCRATAAARRPGRLPPLLGGDVPGRLRPHRPSGALTGAAGMGVGSTAPRDPHNPSAGAATPALATSPARGRPQRFPLGLPGRGRNEVLSGLMSGNSDGWCAYARRRWKVWRRAFEVVVLCRAFRELETLVVRQRQNWQLELAPVFHDAC